MFNAQATRDYYLRGLSPEDGVQFLGMIEEMAHLTRPDQGAAFSMVYQISGKPPAAIDAALGYLQKRLASCDQTRGLTHP